jgi:hypothetical protein
LPLRVADEILIAYLHEPASGTARLHVQGEKSTGE